MTFSYTPGYELYDLEFPVQYQPLFPLRIDNKPVFNQAQFNNQIEQVTSWGENQLAREFVVEYFLPIASANEVDFFLQSVVMYNKWFYWSAGNIAPVAIKVRCKSWTKELSAHNRARIKATFVEAFNFSTEKNRALSIATGSYSINLNNATLSKGRWLGADASSYSIGAIDATLYLGKFISADTAAFSVTALPAGPDFYYINADPSSYSIGGSDSDSTIVIGGDYFANMAIQIFGWESLFYVEWWGS